MKKKKHFLQILPGMFYLIRDAYLGLKLKTMEYLEIKGKEIKSILILRTSFQARRWRDDDSGTLMSLNQSLLLHLYHRLIVRLLFFFSRVDIFRSIPYMISRTRILFF